MDTLVVVVICVGLIILGLISIFAKDLTWEWTQFSNRAKGLESNRTPEWETGSTIGGVISVIAGIVLLLMYFGMNQ